MSERAFGLYVHIPFCEKKCAYCDFNTYAGLQSHFSATVDALCAEMARWRLRLADRRITSIFIGGGTPTVLEPAQLTQLFAAIRLNFSLASDCEINCEANPGTVDRAKFRLLYSLGVNRLSMGVQSFQPDELHFLNRIHSVEDALLAYSEARLVGFDNINLDFIFGAPGQSVEAWQATLEQAIALQPEHLSLYSLIVEPDTPLFHWVEKGQVAAPDEDVAAELYEAALARLGAAGYRHYEVSNWARRTPGELEEGTPHFACRHNLLYWRNEEYLGIGPGAHSHLSLVDDNGSPQHRRWGNRKPVPGYVKRINAGQSVEASGETIDWPQEIGETMMLGLRLRQEGVPFARFTARHGQDLRQLFAGELAELQGYGLLTVDSERVKLTERGLMLGNQVFGRFLPD